MPAIVTSALASAATAARVTLQSDDGGGGGGGSTASGRSTMIGVAISLAGNVLISLALNVQKLAHVQLQGQQDTPTSSSPETMTRGATSARGMRSRLGHVEETTEEASLAAWGENTPSQSRPSGAEGSCYDDDEEDVGREREPLVGNGATAPSSYGSTALLRSALAADGGPANGKPGPEAKQHSAPSPRVASPRSWRPRTASDRAHAANVGRDSNRSPSSSSLASASSQDNGPSSAYLRSKLWWLGLGLMTVGEGGNFLSYGFAPASLVAPLGAVALLSNVLISPLLLKERFRPSDLGGIVLSIVGAITVVWASREQDPSLGPEELWDAIASRPFEVYASIAAGVIALLASLSFTELADRFVLVDVGVCALFGGFTVLSTKGLSSLISRGRPFEFLEYAITYLLFATLVATAVAQITYLNRALQRFDSREVIPTQFVLFTISAIVGSSILYRDFANFDAHRLANFLFGVLTTFAGVFVLTKRRGRDEDVDAEDEDEDGGSEAIGARQHRMASRRGVGRSMGVEEVQRALHSRHTLIGANPVELDAEAATGVVPLAPQDDAARQAVSGVDHDVAPTPARRIHIANPTGSLGRRSISRAAASFLGGLGAPSAPPGAQSTSLTSSLGAPTPGGGGAGGVGHQARKRLSIVGNLGSSARGFSAGHHLLLATTPPMASAALVAPPSGGALAFSLGGGGGGGGGGTGGGLMRRRRSGDTASPAVVAAGGRAPLQRSVSQPSTPTRRRSRADVASAANRLAGGRDAARGGEGGSEGRPGDGDGGTGGHPGTSGHRGTNEASAEGTAGSGGGLAGPSRRTGSGGDGGASSPTWRPPSPSPPSPPQAPPPRPPRGPGEADAGGSRNDDDHDGGDDDDDMPWASSRPDRER